MSSSSSGGIQESSGLCALALGAGSMVACGDDDDDDVSAASEAPATGSPAATSGDAGGAATTSGGGDEGGGGELEICEQAGGDAPMVDALVAAWNEENPDCQINLTYIPHATRSPSGPRSSRPATCWA